MGSFHTVGLSIPGDIPVLLTVMGDPRMEEAANLEMSTWITSMALQAFHNRIKCFCWWVPAVWGTEKYNQSLCITEAMW